MSKIKGITIELNGDTTGLTEALKDVNKESSKTQTELKSVERALKMDPGNVELLRQKQELLTNAVQATAEKLGVLRTVQSQVEAQFQRGEIGVEQYREFQRELANTEAALRGYEGELSALDSQQERFADAQQRLRTYMEATGQSANDLASTLGSRLAGAIRDGSASTDQMEMALRRLGQEAGHTGQDLSRFQDTLRNQNNHNLDEIRRDLEEIGQAAGEAEGDLKGLGGALGGLAAGAGAAAGVAAVTGLVEEMTEVNQALGMLEVQANNANVALEDIGAGKTALSAVRHDANQIAETMGNLMQAGYESADSINKISEALAGAKVKYGETFSGEGLAESITTTTQLGEVTGQLTDLLEKEGVNVESFNAKMQELSTVQERANYISQLLADQGLNAMYQEYARLNPELVTNAEATTANESALAELATQLTPLVTMMKEFATAVAEWITSHEGLAVAIVSIVTVIGALVSVFALLMPAIGALVTAWPVLTGAIASIGAPILIAVAAIVGLGAAFVALWQNSETFRENLTNVFNAIQEVAVSVFEAVASFIGEKVTWIKEFWAQEGGQFLTAVENVFNGIMAVVEFVMPAVQMLIDVVWGAIKNIITGALNVIMGAVKVFSGLFTGDLSKMWEGVKQLFKGAIDLVLGFMTLSFVGGIRALITNFSKTLISMFSSKWTSIVNLFKTGGTGAINAVKSMASSVVSFVKNLSTNFVNLINTMKTNVVSKFTALKDDIITKVKSINLLQVGKDLVSGLIKGITSMTAAAIESITGIVDGVVGKAKSLLKIASPSKIFKEIGAWTGEGLALGIESTKGMNEQAITDIGKVLIKATEANAKEVSAIAKKVEEERTKLQKTYAAKRDNLKKADAEKIQALENELNEKLKVINDKAWADMQKKEAEAAQARLEAVVSFVNGKKQANELSLIDEAQYWRAAYKEFDSGSAEHLALRDQYRDNVNRINEAITSVNEKYLSEAQKINDDLIKGEENANKKYSDALDSRYNTIVNYFDLFGEVTKEEAVSTDTLMKNLNDQVAALEDWASQIDQLKNKGLSMSLIDELEQMGPKATEKLRALNSMTEKELQDYQNVYKEKMQLARTTAIKELEPLQKQTQAQIQTLRNTASSELNLLNTQWQQAINEVVGGTETKLKTLNEVGKNAGQGLLNGLSSMQSALVDKANEIAESISSTIQEALDIHSPSRVMKGFGVNIGQGLIVGMDDMLSKVAQSSVRLSDAVQSAHGSIASSTNKSSANQAAQQQQVIYQQQQSIDLRGLISAIADLANKPTQVDLLLDSQVLTRVVSESQHRNATIGALTRGVKM